MLLVNERRKRITAADTARAVTLLNELAIQVDGPPSLQPFDGTLLLARAHHLSSYDASYLELALRQALPLATLDVQMRVAASAAAGSSSCDYEPPRVVAGFPEMYQPFCENCGLFFEAARRRFNPS